jgi:hypothetical protein
LGRRGNTSADAFTTSTEEPPFVVMSYTPADRAGISVNSEPDGNRSVTESVALVPRLTSATETTVSAGDPRRHRIG